jgi:hypothetical protein
LRLYRSSHQFVPLGPVRIKNDGTWKAENCNVGGEPDDRRGLGVYLVGPSALALFEYYRDAGRIHKELMKVAPPSNANKSLPPIADGTADMVKCAEVWVFRS